MSDYKVRYEKYASLRRAVNENGDAFKEFLVNFVESAPLYSGHFNQRKKEIETRLSAIVQISNRREKNDFDSILQEIFPVQIFNDAYENDCEIMNQIEIILDVLEDSK